jgi:hypothetical protein
MSEKEIKEAILTLDVLIDCCKEDGTTYNAKKEWDALDVFKKLQQENQQLKEVIEEVREYIKEWQHFPHTNGVIHNELKNLLQILDKGVKDE